MNNNKQELLSESRSDLEYNMKQNNKKISRTRRQRGYHWEETIVKRLNRIDGWRAFRLGSPSTSLPDVLAVNTLKSTILSIEAKSGTVSSLPVPRDQIQRCLYWTSSFDIYKTRNVILAFKFLSKKRIGLGKYESRKLKEYFKIWDTSFEPQDCICNYDGETFLLNNGKREKIFLNDYLMPFQ